jgi:hypothetical protein
MYDDQLSQGDHGVCLFYSITPFVCCNQDFRESSGGVGTSGGVGGKYWRYASVIVFTFPTFFLQPFFLSHVSPPSLYGRSLLSFSLFQSPQRFIDDWFFASFRSIE